MRAGSLPASISLTTVGRETPRTAAACSVVRFLGDRSERPFTVSGSFENLGQRLGHRAGKVEHGAVLGREPQVGAEHPQHLPSAVAVLLCEHNHVDRVTSTETNERHTADYSHPAKFSRPAHVPPAWRMAVSVAKR